MHIHQHRCRALGVHQLHAAIEHAFCRRLNRQVQRKGQRLAAIGRVTQHVIKSLFDACDADHLGGTHAFTPKARAALNMRRQFSVRIEPHLTRAEQQAGIADVMHQLLLLRAQFLAHPQELTLASEIFQKAGFVQVREDLDQFLGHPFLVDHLMRLRVKTEGLKVGGQNAPVAVHDVGALRQNAGSCCIRAGFCRFAAGEPCHTQTDDAKRREEHDAQNQEPPFGPHTGLVAHLFVALADVLFFDDVGIFALCTGANDGRERAQWRADHWPASWLETSTIPSITELSSGG